MNEMDFSNPVMVIGVFLTLILTGFMFIIKLMPAIIGLGVVGSLFSLATGGFVWFSIFSEK